MKIIRETNRKVGTIKDYRVILVPSDRLVCPECNKEIITFKLYKSMDISKELEQIKEQ